MKIGREGKKGGRGGRVVKAESERKQSGDNKEQ